MNNIISSSNLIRALVIGCLGITTAAYAQQAPAFDPYQIGGIQQPEGHTEYASAQAWADVYKKNSLISINKESISLYANIPVSSIIAQAKEILTVAGISAVLSTAAISYFPEYYAYKTTEGRSFFFKRDGSWDEDSVISCIVLPALWLGLVLLRLPEWKKTITNVRELWGLATQKTPLLSFRSQGIILGNKTKIRWSEIGNVTKVQRQNVLSDGATETTLHLSINNLQGTCIAEIPGILLPTTIDAILELVGYYQKHGAA
jgi:hypothetical protein